MRETERPQQRRRERRQERIEERRRIQVAQERRDRLVKGGIIAGTALVTVALLGWVVWANLFQEKPGQDVPSLGNAHIQPPQTFDGYNSDPPTSGPHYPTIARWGIHTEAVQKELQVHNLEDGGVAVQYHCPEECPDLVKQLEEVVKGYQERVLLAPYPGMDARIALTAWGRIDKFDEFDAGRITRFIQTFRGVDHHQRR